jgi:integrase
VQYDYKLLLKSHVLGHAIAKRPIAEVNDGHVSLFIKDISQRKTRRGNLLSARRVNMVIARLRTIFATAHRRKLMAVDPMPHIKNLREAKPDVDPFDLGESLRLIKAARYWERSFLTVLLFTGMRPNEALALSWDSIDFEHGLIRIRRTLNRRYGFGLPKTPGSERDVEMSGTVRAELQEQRARSQLRAKLVFPSEAGTPIDLANFRARRWPKILTAAKVRARVIYQCRHTFARLALEQGDTQQHVAAMLGHTTLEMLFRVYSRWMSRPAPNPVTMREATARLGTRLRRGQCLSCLEVAYPRNSSGGTLRIWPEPKRPKLRPTL